MAENRKKKTSENSKPSKKKTQPKGIWDRMKHTVHLMRTSTRFRHGSMATVMTVIFFVFIVLLNMAVMKMKDRYSFMSIDMTDDKRYTLTAETEKLIKGIGRLKKKADDVDPVPGKEDSKEEPKK